MGYGLLFLIFAVQCKIVACTIWGWHSWLLLWTAESFAIVAAAYLGVRPVVFGKRSDGRIAIWAYVLLLPYMLFTWGAR